MGVLVSSPSGWVGASVEASSRTDGMFSVSVSRFKPCMSGVGSMVTIAVGRVAFWRSYDLRLGWSELSWRRPEVDVTAASKPESSWGSVHSGS